MVPTGSDDVPETVANGALTQNVPLMVGVAATPPVTETVTVYGEGQEPAPTFTAIALISSQATIVKPLIVHAPPAVVATVQI